MTGFGPSIIPLSSPSHRRNPEKNSSECQEQMLPSSEYQHVTDSYAVDDTPENNIENR